MCKEVVSNNSSLLVKKSTMKVQRNSVKDVLFLRYKVSNRNRKKLCQIIFL